MIMGTMGIYRLLLLTGILTLCASFSLAHPAGCNTADIRGAVDEHKLGRSNASFVHLRTVRDSAEISDKYIDCRVHKFFWVRMVEANLLLSKYPSLSKTEKLFYLNSAESDAIRAVNSAEESTEEDARLSELMVDVYSSLATKYFDEKDSLRFSLAMHKRDSVYEIIAPRPEAIEITNRTESLNPPVLIKRDTNLSAPINSNRVDQQTVVVQIYLYDESTRALEHDSLQSAVVTATEMSSNNVITIVANNGNGDYEFKLAPFKTYSIKVERSGYAGQARTVRTDGSGSMIQRYYLARSGVPVYYTSYGMQVPYDRNDKYVGIRKNDKCNNSSFEQFIKDLGLVKCAGDSVQLYRKANGLAFNAASDTALFQLRAATDKVDWAGPVIGPIRGYPLVLTGRIKIYFMTEESKVQEKDKTELKKILDTRGFKTEGGGWYAGPKGIGGDLNSITGQINQLPFVWFAIAESVQQEH